MKALILHCNRWASRPESPSERIGGCTPDAVQLPPVVGEDYGARRYSDQYSSQDCLVAFFQVEVADSERHVRQLCKDIKKIAEKVGTTRLVVECFAHLSHSRPDPEVAKILVAKVLETCRGFGGYEIHTSPFGWNKGLVLDIKGHPDAFKHRSY